MKVVPALLSENHWRTSKHSIAARFVRRTKHACLMLRMRLSLDRGCVAIATQGRPDKPFTIESLTGIGTAAVIKLLNFSAASSEDNPFP